MKKAWAYIAAFLAGALTVAMVAWKFVGDTYKGSFRFKQKGEGNIQKPQLNLEVEKGRKEKRLQKKLDRLQEKS